MIDNNPRIEYNICTGENKSTSRESKMHTHVSILLEETPGWPRRTSVIFCVCFAGERKTRGERALRVTRVRSGEKKGYTPIHTSSLFHRINDATANSIRKGQPSVLGKKLFHVILERVCKRGYSSL